MKREWDWWKTAILCLIGMALALWIVLPLDALHDCIQQRKNYERYQPLHKEGFSIVHLRLRFRLNSVCVVHLAVPFERILIALSGVAVAGFTATLWLVTRRSIVVAGRAADAALLQSRAAVGSQISEIVVSQVLLVNPDQQILEQSIPIPAGPIPQLSRVIFQVTNIGPSRSAIISQCPSVKFVSL